MKELYEDVIVVLCSKDAVKLIRKRVFWRIRDNWLAVNFMCLGFIYILAFDFNEVKIFLPIYVSFFFLFIRFKNTTVAAASLIYPLFDTKLYTYTINTYMPEYPSR